MAVNKTPIVAIVGRANAGKSTLYNRLVGERRAITHDKPGTTRDAITATVKWGKHTFWLVDTAGLKPAENEMEASIQEQIEQAASSADVIILVSDGTGEVTVDDLAAAKLVHRSGKPAILAVNKLDAASKAPDANWRQLGIPEIIKVSAMHGTGTGDLLDRVVELMEQGQAPEDVDLTLAMLGRPNVGKSSILNSLMQKQQAVVSSSAGTTRDVNSGRVRYQNRTIELLDTAGLRRRGKIERGVEQFSTIRTLAAIAESDVCVLIMDATEPSVAGDQHIAGLVQEAGKGLILVVNKWDLIEKDEKTQDEYLAKLKRDFQFAWWAPVIFTSAVTGLNVTKLFELALQIQERRRVEIATGELNRLVQNLVSKHPPAGLKNRHPKINYVTQTATEPPTFTFFAAHPKFLHFSYKRYLENGLREAYDFTGTPIALEFRDKRKD
jgi:GTPase